ncbi:SapB/AmfS family lanthipeptide [Micromonospora sp. WMMD882]|nr:SapB/AmfS family lanthipeptide [Micromonospora sp. WMMD882]WBB77790.1 SapB/AmfS family lanthipeptide [Micromonospora sp. WMMD882]
MPHVLDLQTLAPEEQSEGLNSNLSLVTCPDCPSTPSLLVCC